MHIILVDAVDLNARGFDRAAGEMDDFVVAVFDVPVKVIARAVVGGGLSAEAVNGRSPVRHFSSGRERDC